MPDQEALERRRRLQEAAAGVSDESIQQIKDVLDAQAEEELRREEQERDLEEARDREQMERMKAKALASLAQPDLAGGIASLSAKSNSHEERLNRLDETNGDLLARVRSAEEAVAGVARRLAALEGPETSIPAWLMADLRIVAQGSRGGRTLTQPAYQTLRRIKRELGL